MAKVSLILMLVTTQLLAGSGGAVYLCISSDGSFCCVDSGPDLCTCCKHNAEDAEICDHDCCHEPVACDQHSKHQAAPHTDSAGSITDEPCGCTHILISAEQPSAVVRTTNPAQNEQIWHMLAWLPNLVSGSEKEVVPDQPPIRYGPPAVPDAHLAVQATVVIRC